MESKERNGSDGVYIGMGTVCSGLTKKGDKVYGYYVEIPAPMLSSSAPVGYIFYPNKERNKKENYMNRIEVLPNTIRRFTGIFDISGNPIFDGDEVELISEDHKAKGTIVIDYGSVYVYFRYAYTYIMITRHEKVKKI